MRYALLCLLALLVAIQPVSARSTVTFSCAGSVIALLDSTDAAIVSARPDAYTKEHTSFDLSIRLNKKPAEVKGADYLRAAAKNVRNWSVAEQAQLRSTFASIDSFAKVTKIRLRLPDTVKMIRTTAAEEFGAEGYTRENRIMLNTGVQPISLHLLAHELWHVISRYNEALRNNAYAVFHFKPCNNIIYKPALQNRVVTNPDCPFLMHYVTVEKDGRKQDMALIFYMNIKYEDDKVVGQDLDIGLLALTGDDAHKTPLLKDGKAVIYGINETPQLLEQVGMNTQYLLHVEEITAEHFAALISGKQYPQMEYVTGVRDALMK